MSQWPRAKITSGDSWALSPPCVLLSLPTSYPPGPILFPRSGKLCLGIVFPKKLPLWCHGVTQSPESQEGGDREAWEGGGGKGEKAEGPDLVLAFLLLHPLGLGSPFSCTASVSPGAKGRQWALLRGPQSWPSLRTVGSWTPYGGGG